jgi:hypothetical protein
MVYINPKWIICEFLRSRLIDPRSERRPTLNTNSITAIEDQTVVPLTFTTGKSLSYINKVEVNSAEKRKWVDYYIDFRNNKIVFFNKLSAGDVVEIEVYETSTDWIYWDRLHGKLKKENFPRISVLVAAGTGVRQGNYEAPIEYYLTAQIDIYAKEKAVGQIFRIDDKNYTGEELAERIAYDVQEVFDKYENDMHPALYNYNPSSFPPRNVPYDETLQCHRKIVDCELSGINVGRIE